MRRFDWCVAAMWFLAGAFTTIGVLWALLSGMIRKALGF